MGKKAELATVDPDEFQWPPGVYEQLATLTGKQARFVQEYILDFNATAAVLRAGYNAANRDYAAQIGWKLLRHPKVGAVVADLAEMSADQMGISRAYVLANLRTVAEKAIEGGPKFVGKDGMIARDDDGRIVYEWDSAGANKALELLARLRGDMIERKQVDVRTVNIQINDVSVEDLQ